MKQLFRFICWLPKYWFGGTVSRVKHVHTTFRHMLSQEPFLGTLVFVSFSAIITIGGCLITAGVYYAVTGVGLPIAALVFSLIWWYAPISVAYFLVMIFHNLYDRFLEHQNQVFDVLKGK